MALQMSYVDGYGNTNPSSYWRVVFVAVDLQSSTARAVIQGWKDADAYTNGKQSIGSKEVVVTGDDFTAMMTTYQQPNGNTDLFSLAYNVAKTQDDFFNGATEV